MCVEEKFFSEVLQCVKQEIYIYIYIYIYIGSCISWNKGKKNDE